MIKGKTLIELTDVKTGVTEVIREKNMVTNALKSIYQLSYFGEGTTSVKQALKNVSLGAPRNFGDSPSLVGDLIGGVLCYSDPIQEDVNTFFASFDNELIAHAATNINDDAQNFKRGSFNEKESGPTGNNGYKFVWDFATSQGNGEISSICLTSYLGGLLGDLQHAEYLLKTKKILLDAISYSSELNNKRKLYEYVYSHIVDVNIEENTGTAIGFVYKGNQPKIVIWKVRLPLTKMFLSASGGLISPIISEYEVPNTEVSADTYRNIMNMNGYNSIICSDDEHYYIITKKPLAYMLKIKKSDMSMVSMEIDTSILNGNIWGYFNLDNYERINGYYTGFAIKDGKIYIGVSNGIKIIDSSTGVLLGEIVTNITKKLYNKNDGVISLLKHDGHPYTTHARKIKNLTCENSKAESNYIFNYNASSNPISMLNTPFFIMFSNDAVGISTFADYLVTINNLQTPVTKTADKTMKITYIIEEV